MLPALTVTPDLHARTWGGHRLAPPGDEPIGEAWIAGPANRVDGGPFAGRTLDDLASELGPALVGAAATTRRFPFLVKLLDPAAWLSVQVHPDDATAHRLAGPDANGKTEAWYVLEAEPGAELLAGVRPGADPETIRALVRRADARLEGLLARHRVHAGDAILVPAGTPHTIGPGLLLYELQQPSDLTYRVYDWGRTATPARQLHPVEAEASVDPTSTVAVVHVPREGGRESPARETAVHCAHFALDVIDLGAGPVSLDPAGQSVHVLTVAEGGVAVGGGTGSDRWRIDRARLDTIVVPSDAGPYEIVARGRARVLLARLP